MKNLVPVRQGPSPRGPSLLSLVSPLHFPTCAQCHHALLLGVPQISHRFASPFHSILFFFPVHLGSSCTSLKTLHSHQPFMESCSPAPSHAPSVLEEGWRRPASTGRRLMPVNSSAYLCSKVTQKHPQKRCWSYQDGWSRAAIRGTGSQCSSFAATPTSRPSCWSETVHVVCESFWQPSLW